MDENLIYGYPCIWLTPKEKIFAPQRIESVYYEADKKFQFFASTRSARNLVPTPYWVPCETGTTFFFAHLSPGATSTRNASPTRSLSISFFIELLT